ncbi:MAG: hypothetical protein B7733_05860 [Myxococcales bacterium FL481]|nr:MAG: hypothetical protein B7733_05860 [Myxococcales bacterium FL481]
MATYNMPLFPALSHYRYKLVIDPAIGQSVVEIHWSPADTTAGTDGAWHMNLLTPGGDPLVMGIKLALGKDLLARYQYDSRVPKVKLNVVETGGTGQEAGRDDLKSRVLVQFERDE